MIFTDTLVAYDATDRSSTRHVMRRNGPHVALCGEQLQPWGRFRVLEGFETDSDQPEADCRRCLSVRAQWIVQSLLGYFPLALRNAVNEAADADEQIVLMLTRVLESTSLSAVTLVQEHFPRALVERAQGGARGAAE